MHAENPRHHVSAADALGHAFAKRRSPYIYSVDEIARLLRGAAALEPAGSIRPTMYGTLFGLLAATGMRIAEALALQLDDVTTDGLVIRETKFQKSRLLPLHTTTRQAHRWISGRLPVAHHRGSCAVRIGRPEIASTSRVGSMRPMKKTDQALVGYLTRDELQALLDAPNASTVSGIRDRAMLHLAFAAGMRVSELLALRLNQIDRQTMASVHIMGKRPSRACLAPLEGDGRGCKGVAERAPYQHRS